MQVNFRSTIELFFIKTEIKANPNFIENIDIEIKIHGLGTVFHNLYLINLIHFVI
jgi:hypothetical protein